MPYILPKIRELLSPVVESLSDVTIDSPGELNYLITCLCNDYFKQSNKNYQSVNDVIGALEGAKLEFYRRIAAPYEDVKCTENGDVYDRS